MAPQIASVFPHGARIGTTAELTIRGENLDGASHLAFASPGIHTRILSAKSRKVHAQVTISPDAETGTHEFRLFTPSGTSLGVFEIGSLGELSETEPNDKPATAQEIPYPIVINGTAGAEDADFFRIRARAGQTLSLDIAAARNGSALDPALALLDEQRREIAYCDDYFITKDAHLEYTFARTGLYFIRVNASYSRSAPNADYRLTVTDQGFPLYTVPAGAQSGSTAELTIRGANLETVSHVWLDHDGGRADVVARSTSELKIRLAVPAGMRSGRHRLHLAANRQELAAPLRFDISDLPETTVADSRAADRAHPLLLRIPAIVNSEIAARGGDYLHRTHVYEFDAPAGARYEFHAQSWDLGLRADPVVTLLAPDGKKLAFEDDPAPNSFIHYPATHDPRMVFRFAQAGRYRLLIRDAMYRGGSGFIYRLTIQPVRPDFYVNVHTPQLTAYVGRNATIHVQVHRTGGVHTVECFKHPDSEIENFRIQEVDGWRAPVTLWVDGAPDNVTAERVAAEPKNTTFKGNDGEDLFVDGTVVDVPIHIGPQARPGTYSIRIRAESSFDGRTEQRLGTVFRKNRALKLLPEQESEVYLTIVKPPPILLTAPARLEVTKGGSTHFKLNLFYFEQASGSIVIEAHTGQAGLSMSPTSVPVGNEELEMPVQAASDMRDSEARVVLIARDIVSGRILGESAPVIVQVTAPEGSRTGK